MSEDKLHTNIADIPFEQECSRKIMEGFNSLVGLSGLAVYYRHDAQDKNPYYICFAGAVSKGGSYLSLGGFGQTPDEALEDAMETVEVVCRTGGKELQLKDRKMKSYDFVVGRENGNLTFHMPFQFVPRIVFILNGGIRPRKVGPFIQTEVLKPA